MMRIASISAILAAAALATVSSPLSAATSAVPAVAQPTSSVCSVGLGAGDGSPAWSEIDVTANRSVDLDLTEGAGMTVACGTAAAPGFQPAASGLPGAIVDPSSKGDFGSL
jgi:hypothetical protein